MTPHQFLSPFRGLGGLLSSLWAGILIAIAGWGFLANPVLGMFLFCVGLIAVFICLMPPVTSTAFSPPLPKFRQTFSIPSPINCFILYLNATRRCVAFFLHYYLSMSNKNTIFASGSEYITL